MSRLYQSKLANEVKESFFAIWHSPSAVTVRRRCHEWLDTFPADEGH